MVISNDVREQVIKEYEQEKYLTLCERRVRSKPLGRAQQYFRLLTYRYGSITGKSWQSEVNEAVKSEICNRYGISKIRELRPEDYDEANEYAIELFTEETEIRGYKKDEVTIATMPWIKSRFTGGRLTKTLRRLTWDEWKKSAMTKFIETISVSFSRVQNKRYYDNIKGGLIHETIKQGRP